MVDLRYLRSDRLTITPETTLDGTVRWHVSADLRAEPALPYLVYRNINGELVTSPLTLTHTVR